MFFEGQTFAVPPRALERLGGDLRAVAARARKAAPSPREFRARILTMSDDMRSWILNEVDAEIRDGSRSLETEPFVVGYRKGKSHGLAQFDRTFLVAMSSIS